MKILADSWSPHKGSYKFPIFFKATIECRIAGVGEILVYGHPKADEDNPKPILLYSQNNHLYIRDFLEGFEALEIKAKEFGCMVKLDGVEIGESMNAEPAIQPPPAKNLLQKMRNKMREEMGVQREVFLNNTGRPGYEVDDDDDDEIFEEHIIAQKQAAKAQKQKTGTPPPEEPAPASDDTSEAEE